jgi:hypothetical protein
VFTPLKLKRPTFCNLCRTLITIINPGLKCDGIYLNTYFSPSLSSHLLFPSSLPLSSTSIVCRYTVHPECAHPAPKNCRNGVCSHVPHSTPPNSTSSSISPPLSPSSPPETHAVQPHHWVEGNLPQKGVCDSCGLGCTSVACLLNSRCAWCKRLAHATCLVCFPPFCFFSFIYIVYSQNCIPYVMVVSW